VCGYLYDANYGCLVVLISPTRIPIAIGIICIFFGFRVTSWWPAVLFFGSLWWPLALTIPRSLRPCLPPSYLSPQTLDGFRGIPCKKFTGRPP